MLLLVAAGEVLGMSLWFSATAAAPAMVRELGLQAGTAAWLTMAVQAGFVAGTLITAVTNLADAINARRLSPADLAAAYVARGALRRKKGDQAGAFEDLTRRSGSTRKTSAPSTSAATRITTSAIITGRWTISPAPSSSIPVSRRPISTAA